MLPLNGREGAKLGRERGLACRERFQGQEARNNRELVTRSFMAGGGWGGTWCWSPVGSGQFQELLQCVLFHSLHEKLIVLGEGRGGEGRDSHLNAGVLSQV